MSKYNYGYIESPVDERDYNYADIMGAAGDSNVELPEEFKLEFFDNINEYNQGATNMCCAFVLTIINQFNRGEKKRFSPLSIYGNRYDTDYQGNGLITRQAAAHAVKEGMCYIDDLPFLVDMPEAAQIFENNKSVLLPKMADHKIESYFTINLEDLKRYIYTEKKPALLAIPVYNSFERVGKDGIIDENTGKMVGGHAITVIGWTKEGRWILANTWGIKWGDNGYGYYNQNLDIREIWGFTSKKIEKPKEHYTLYRVQVGAYKVKDNAMEKMQELRDKGIACILYFDETKQLYKVQVGAYKNQINAYEALIQILRLGILDAYMVSVEV